MIFQKSKAYENYKKITAPQTLTKSDNRREKCRLALNKNAKPKSLQE